MYKYEIHVHTSDCSKCGGNTVEEMIDTAIQMGYAGIAFTNHFYHGNTAIDKDLPWQEFVGAYRDSYEKAKDYASKLDFDVIFGIEEKYDEGKEVLIYGLLPEDIMEATNFKDMDLEQLAQFVRQKGGIMACAHPFRVRPWIPNPDDVPDAKLFDAVEVYNSHNNEIENDKALQFAKNNGLYSLAGGDHHLIEKFGGSGMAFYHRIHDEKEFVRAIMSRQYKLIIEEKLVEI